MGQGKEAEMRQRHKVPVGKRQGINHVLPDRQTRGIPAFTHPYRQHGQQSCGTRRKSRDEAGKATKIMEKYGATINEKDGYAMIETPSGRIIVGFNENKVIDVSCEFDISD